jgi:2-desacetyl-2-hydroxyethyl bacteriochlorophyllide A dehydrogenase
MRHLKNNYILMKSILLEKPSHFVQKEIEFDSELSDNEVLIKIHRIGICGTDIHAYKGNQPFFSYPRRLGHELGAEVVAIGNLPKNMGLNVGDKVSVEPYLTCGQCQPCLLGKTNCCESLQCLGVHTDGGMCEYIKMPSEKLHKSSKLAYEQLALVETLGIGCHAVNRAEIKKNELVLVIGAGPIGLAVIQFAQLKGAEIAVLDTNQNRLNFAKNNFDIAHTILLDGELSDADLRKKFNGNLPNTVFDATGNPKSMMNAFNFVSFGGKLVFVGLFQGDVTFNDPFFHRREITLMSSRNAQATDFSYIIQNMELGKINTNPWLTHQANYEQFIDLFEEWLKPESNMIKGMISF